MGTGRVKTVGEYNVIRLLGNGGMGAVYEVEHRALGVRYALKTFALDHGEVDFLRERFIAEARALARLSHPNLARVFDLGVMDDGTAYFVMDLVLDPEGGIYGDRRCVKPCFLRRLGEGCVPIVDSGAREDHSLSASGTVFRPPMRHAATMQPW